MGRVELAYDYAMRESFFSTLQRELLDRRSWSTRRELASAIFEWIEAWYNPRRRHTLIDDLSPVDYERLYTTAIDAACLPRSKQSGKPGQAQYLVGTVYFRVSLRPTLTAQSPDGSVALVQLFPA